jgi:hypothetical protein
MEYIYSKVEFKLLLHIIMRTEDMTPGRNELVPEENFIQCAALTMPMGRTFKPHKHIWKQRDRQVIAQESWVVLKGKVKCIFYDLDDSIIAEVILNEGDASFTLQGGHNYEILEDNTKVLEFKTGPYEGQHNDKKFI